MMIECYSALLSYTAIVRDTIRESRKCIFLIFNLLIFSLSTKAQLPANYPETYICYQTEDAIIIDGKLSEKSWKKAPWSIYFSDLENGSAAEKGERTRFKMLWDDNYLYLAGELEETDIRGEMTERESRLYEENAFEFFLDPDGDNHNYMELEINALNTIWDLKMNKPYRDGGQLNDAWNMRGLKTAIQLCGSLNDPKKKDKKWYVEAAFAWEDLLEMAQYRSKPWNGALWKMNFLRTDWEHVVVNNDGEKRVQRKNCKFWAWQPVGAINMHQPEKWAYLQFSKNKVGESTVVVQDLDFELKMTLMEIYEQQKRYFLKHKKYCFDLKKLDIEQNKISKIEGGVRLEETKTAYEAKANGLKAIYVIRENGQLQRIDYR